MKERKGNRVPMIGLCMLFLVIMAGCAPALFRANPQLQEKATSIKTIAIMPPGIKVYQLAVGGGTEFMGEPTTAATQVLAAAIEKELGRHAGVVFTPFLAPSVGLDASRDPAAARLAAELEDATALFEAVSASIVSQTYKHGEGALSDWRFVEKLTNFDYSLGPDVQRLATLANADALLFISGVDHISTGGRNAAIVLGALALFLPTFGASINLLGALGGPTTVSVVLVDATTGALLWYNVVGDEKGYALTDPGSSAALLERVFEDFPLGMTPTRNQYDRRGWPSGLGPH